MSDRQASRTHGTITNTLAAVCDVSGEIIPNRPTAER